VNFRLAIARCFGLCIALSSTVSVAHAATPQAVDLALPPAPLATGAPGANDMTAADRAIASHLTAKRRKHLPARDWVLTGFLSKHFSEDNRENDKNFGVFFEHDFSKQWGLYFGQYENSGKIRSHLIAATWQPMHIGPVRVGFEGGIVDGYMQLNRGHFAPAALPFLSYTMGPVKANLFCIPPVIKTAAPVCSLQFGANLEDLTAYATKLRTSRAQ